MCPAPLRSSAPATAVKLTRHCSHKDFLSGILPGRADLNFRLQGALLNTAKEENRNE
jgi:hypothetical protein